MGVATANGSGQRLPVALLLIILTRTLMGQTRRELWPQLGRGETLPWGKFFNFYIVRLCVFQYTHIHTHTYELIYIKIRSDCDGSANFGPKTGIFNHLASIKYNLQNVLAARSQFQKVLVSILREIQLAHLKLKRKVAAAPDIQLRQLLYTSIIVLMLDLRPT